MSTVTINGVSYEASEQVVQAVAQLQAELAECQAQLPTPEDEAAAATAAAAAATEMEALQAQVAEATAATTPEAMDLAFGTGFWATFLLMQAAYPHLVESKGSVINFGSGAGIDGMATQGSYGAAKEAIRSLSKVAATEWGPKGVRINVICPFADSPGVQQWREHFPEAYAAQIGKVPLRRIGDPEKDIGAAAVFLASEAAAYVTGQTLMVDGGQIKSF